MNTIPQNNSNTPKPVPQDRVFENIVTAINRSQALLKIAGDFSASVLEKVKVLKISQLANPDTITAMDIYDRPLEEVRILLDRQSIQSTEMKIVNAQEAYSLRNLGATIGTIAPSSRVDLLTYQGRVIGIRVLGEQKQ
ncbi:MAG: hypothetical protein V7K69_20890 [Nostoc sp.]|uniref:hypothetical protein n=1 Tax=Nostoc sp. TaxID=1180 RepID=UPI002FFB0AC0